MWSTDLGYELVPRTSNNDLAIGSPEQLTKYSPSVRQTPDISTTSFVTTGSRLPRLQPGPLFVQSLLTMFPALFMGLVVATISLDGKPTSDEGEVLQRVIPLTPTVFPIVFAAIIGKFLKALGLYKAERGVKLGILERLIGSQSLFSAIERQFVLRGQLFLGMSIVSIWALSPLGGQSALRILKSSPRITTTGKTIRYLPIEATYLTTLSDEYTAGYNWEATTSFYMTALTTSYLLRESPEDMFGNVKIPGIDLLPSQANRSSSWFSVGHNQSVPYSSLLGIPLVGVPTKGNVSFNMINRYLTIKCDSPSHWEDNLEGNGIMVVDIDQSLFDSGSTFSILVDSGQEATNTQPGNQILSFQLLSANEMIPKNQTGDFSVVNCTLAPRDVELNISCEDQSCQVTAMKNITVNLTEWLRNDGPQISIGLGLLPFTSVNGLQKSEVVISSMFEMWLEQGYQLHSPSAVDPYSNTTWTNLSRVPAEVLSHNFELLFNTFWQSTYGLSYLIGNLSTDMSLYDNLTSEYIDVPVYFGTTQATVDSHDGTQYVCHMTFAALLFAISTLLFLACIATLVLMGSTLAPDVLSYVSSLTRDNVFAEVGAGSHLDGLDRTKMLSDVRFTIGDVAGGSQVGHVAFTALADVQRLRNDRTYD